MSDDRQSVAGPISELLLRWEELRARDEPVSAAELCKDHPELLEEVRRRIQALEAVYRVPNQPPPTTRVGPDDGPAPTRLPQVDGYEILEPLGRGGMGVVFKARHLRRNRLVALKMVRAGHQARPADLLRFRIEAEAVAALAHPHIVQVYEVGEADGCPNLALEYVGGGTLAQRLRDSPLASRSAAELVGPAAATGSIGTGGVLDRSGFVHRGPERGGVQRPYGSRLGKKENGQVGVFRIGVPPARPCWTTHAISPRRGPRTSNAGPKSALERHNKVEFKLLL